MSIADDLDHIAEHVGDNDYNLPLMAKNTLLLAAKALRIVEDADRRLGHFADMPYHGTDGSPFNLLIDATTAIHQAAEEASKP
jgi:hypothetical protein